VVKNPKFWPSNYLEKQVNLGWAGFFLIKLLDFYLFLWEKSFKGEKMDFGQYLFAVKNAREDTSLKNLRIFLLMQNA